MESPIPFMYSTLVHFKNKIPNGLYLSFYTRLHPLLFSCTDTYSTYSNFVLVYCNTWTLLSHFSGLIRLSPTYVPLAMPFIIIHLSFRWTVPPLLDLCLFYLCTYYNMYIYFVNTILKYFYYFYYISNYVILLLHILLLL